MTSQHTHMTSLVQKILFDSDGDKFAMTQNARERCCWHSNIWPTGWFTPHQSIIKLQRHTEVYEETFDVNIKIAQTTQNSWNFNIVGMSSLLKWRKCKLRRLFGRFRTLICNLVPRALFPPRPQSQGKAPWGRGCLICRIVHKSSFSARSATVSAKRDRTSAEREARASERKLVVRAGSYHTRPENHANDFEKVYLIWRPRDTFQNLESPGLSGGVVSTDYFYVPWRREPPFYVFIQTTWRSSRLQCKGSTLISQLL